MTEITHGTTAGYSAHKRLGEAPCDECREAERLYTRERRAAKKAAAPALEWPLHPEGHELVDVLVVAPRPGKQRWNFERWSLDVKTAEKWLMWGSLESVKPGLGLERILEIVASSQTDVTPIRVVILDREDALFYLSRHPDWKVFLDGDVVKPLLVQREDPEDPQTGIRAIMDLTYQGDTKHLPENTPGDYVAKKKKALAGGSDTEHLRADWVAEIAGPHLIVHAVSIFERRKSEGGVEPARGVQGAVVRRGRLMDVGRYERPEPEYEEIPQGHPALLQESWIGGSSAKGPSRR